MREYVYDTKLRRIRYLIFIGGTYHIYELNGVGAIGWFYNEEFDTRSFVRLGNKLCQLL